MKNADINPSKFNRYLTATSEKNIQNSNNNPLLCKLKKLINEGEIFPTLRENTIDFTTKGDCFSALTAVHLAVTGNILNSSSLNVSMSKKPKHMLQRTHLKSTYAVISLIISTDFLKRTSKSLRLLKMVFQKTAMHWSAWYSANCADIHIMKI